MQQKVFEVLSGARSLEDLRRMETEARRVCRKYLDKLGGADVRELAVHRRVSRLNYSRRSAELAPVQKVNPGDDLAYTPDLPDIENSRKRAVH